ncbi:T9SS type A sorting domain-containing protein [Flavobacteriaceae bacterium]|jgi:hypothetical protein|nr:T9SS type A sorting domain-containing protein [Flavobacteriaceae bacterium]
MKYFILILLCVPSMVVSQILTVIDGASIAIENTASISLDGLTIAPSDSYVITGANTVSVTNNPVEVNENSSVNRVYELSTALSDFSGTLVFAYAEDELNGIAESDLVLETLSTDGVWNSYEADVDDANNTLSYDFTNLEFTKITASSVNASLTVEEIAKNDFVKVYPNPTTDKLIIASKNIKNSILYNINGQKVLETDRNKLNVSQLPIGVYLLHTTNNQNQLSTFKIIKK